MFPGCRYRALLLLLLAGGLVTESASAVEPDYSESVAMTGHAPDAAMTFDVRVARMPGQSRGSLWFYVFVDGRQYGLVDETVALVRPGKVDVEEADAVFEVVGSSRARLHGRDRHDPGMTGRLEAAGRLHPLAHPEPGPGEISVEIDAEFVADHQPIQVRPGRIEVMGRVRGEVRIDGHAVPIDLPGKWHEQTGVRPSFAPAFTYLFVQGDKRGLMVTRHQRGAWGYFYMEGEITPVTALAIDAYGPAKRHFTATLEDDREVAGTATLVQQVSVPIEGRRRPGATVIVDSDVGRLVGVLNDWDPDRQFGQASRGSE
jgi:hypothetical protein